MPPQAQRIRLIFLGLLIASLSFVGSALNRSIAQSRQPSVPGKSAKNPLPRPSVQLTPLTDLRGNARYRSEEGGLYGGGKNERPEALNQAALAAAGRIQPLDAKGSPAADGKIVLVAIGMSNTTQEFRRFMALARRDRQKSPSVVLVDGAQGGMVSPAWANPTLPVSYGHNDPWTVLDKHLKEEGGTAPQVQVAWIKQAIAFPGELGEYPTHAHALWSDLAAIIHKLKSRFPNLRLVYLSSRTYGGYASSLLNPEPFAYESAFAVRGMILQRAREEATEPVVLWGPYLWADGLAGRKVDSLIWTREDFAADGTHPSPSGQRKVAELLLSFFLNDSTARPWFRKRTY